VTGKLIRNHDGTFFKKILFFILISSLAVPVRAESYPELEKEIRELQNKIKSSKEKIKNVKKKIKADKKAFSAYQKHNNNYSNRQREELESLKNDYNSLQHKTDSLSQIIQQVKGRQREKDLLQERFSKLLLDACEELKQTIVMLPPGNTQSQLSALAFLQSELSVKAVDNTEALERLWQILSALSENSQSINIFPGQSPVSFISGQVDFIRIGYAYLAIVNEKGTAGALWIPSADSSGGSWVENKNPQQLLALKKCVNIRQGNSVPEIVGIPFNHPIHDDAQDTKGGSQ
jgi:hypothetical protein